MHRLPLGCCCVPDAAGRVHFWWEQGQDLGEVPKHCDDITSNDGCCTSLREDCDDVPCDADGVLGPDGKLACASKWGHGTMGRRGVHGSSELHVVWAVVAD